MNQRDTAISKAKNLRKGMTVAVLRQGTWSSEQFKTINAAKRCMRAQGIGVALREDESLPA